MSEAARRLEQDSSLEAFFPNQENPVSRRRPKGRLSEAKLASAALTWLNDETTNCQGKDPNIFFPNPSDSDGVEVAKQICSGCPVEQECLQHAISNGEYGVWGGTSEGERNKLKRQLLRRRLDS